MYLFHFQKSQIPIKPEQLWKGEFQHKEDILCSDSFKDILVTGSFDGEINVWSLDTQNLFMCLRKGKQQAKLDELHF